MKKNDDFMQLTKERNFTVNDGETATFTEVTKYLEMLEVSKSKNGFIYLREAILLMMAQHEDCEKILITRDIYPRVAKKFHTDIFSVEYDIWCEIQGIDKERLQDKLGYKFSPNQGIIYKEEFLMFINCITNLCQKVKEDLKNLESKQESFEFEVVNRYLQSLKISINLKGYNFLREAILMSMKLEDYESIEITKDIYPSIAKKYKVSCSSVEKAMRHAIQTRVNISDLKSIYGYNISGNVKFTNSEFIVTSIFIIKNIIEVANQDVEADKEKIFTEADAYKEITGYLQALSIPLDRSGFEYLREAIMICVKNNGNPLSRKVYPIVAEKFETTSIRVERNIRRVIQVGLERAEDEDIAKIFGYTYSAERGNPTNSEVIAVIAEIVKNKLFF